MFTGAYPYGEAYAKAQTVREFSLLRYTPAPAHNPLVPSWIDGVLRKAVQVSPELRYESFSELLYDLEHPNQAFAGPEGLPLLQRGSVAFWRGAALALLAGNFVAVIWILTRG